MTSILTAVLFILALEFLLIALSSNSKTAKWFSVLPAIFWMYFLPGVFTRLGWLSIPTELARFSSTWLMPLALILMVAPANLPQLVKMGRQSFATLMAVYASMVFAGSVCFFIFKSVLSADAWKSFAALGATWTGGTVNMLAVKEIVALTESQFSVMVITDAFLSYGWMVFLILMFRWSAFFDSWTRGAKSSAVFQEKKVATIQWSMRDLIWIVLAGGLVVIAQKLGGFMPSTEMFSAKAWVLLISSGLAIFAAGAGWHHLIQSRLAENSGTWLLYFVLMTMRAQADFMPSREDFVVLAAGVVWLLVHGALMILYAKFFRVRLSVVAIASQAAVGGVVSAPVLAALYDKKFVSVAVLMGILGTLVGTYLGLLIGHIARSII